MKRPISKRLVALGALMLLGAAACGDDDDTEPGALGESCQPDDVDACVAGLVCAERGVDDHACFAPVRIQGLVIDSTDESPIEGARLIALDEESVAVSDVAVTDENGVYTLDVPALRDSSDENGQPVSTFTLRAQADAYQSFPGGLRTALPISAAAATRDDDGYVVENALTTVVLIPLPDPDADRYAIAGRVLAGDDREAGVLVVAEGDAGAFTAITDQSGSYVIFNVPPGDYELAGYAAGLQLEPVTASIIDDDLVDVDLEASGRPLTRLSGNIQLVNAPGGSQTSVILVVESTFDNAFGRGETPRGLRAPRTGLPDVTGAWTIEGVPDGRYLILAAFENDDLVRDPDLNIGGTETIEIELPDAQGSDVTLSESFKITEALDVIGPGADGPEAVTSAPDLVWQNDTSEDWYEVRVFNAYGDLVWEDLDVPEVSGQSPPISVMYDGPLEPGMYYQFRAMSWRQPSSQPASPISATEDLRGVFYVPPAP